MNHDRAVASHPARIDKYKTKSSRINQFTWLTIKTTSLKLSSLTDRHDQALARHLPARIEKCKTKS